MKVDELRERLAAFGMKKSGRKRDLVDRIQEAIDSDAENPLFVPADDAIRCLDMCIETTRPDDVLNTHMLEGIFERSIPARIGYSNETLIGIAVHISGTFSKKMCQEDFKTILSSAGKGRQTMLDKANAKKTGVKLTKDTCVVWKSDLTASQIAQIEAGKRWEDIQ